MSNRVKDSDNPSKRDRLVDLHEVLAVRFNESELRTLCFDLEIDYDDLPGAAKTDKARELVAYLERRERIHELAQVGRRLRPDVSWDNILDQRFCSTVNQKQTILFVDDDIEFLSTLLLSLEEEGFEIVAATNLSQAIDALQSKKHIDVVITDMMMPFGGEEDSGEASYLGLEVIAMVRRSRGSIPMICFSVVSSPEIVDEARKLGVAEYIYKPISPSEFVERVKRTLLLLQERPTIDLIQDEIARRRFELKSDNAFTRTKAIWALGELGHHEPTVVDLLKEISNCDPDKNVRTAANEAVEKIQRKLTNSA